MSRALSTIASAVAAGLVSAVAMASHASAQSLTWQPQRVVVDARIGNAALTLTNTGKREEAYRVELVDMIYQDDGRVLPTAQPPAGYPTAKPFVRFSPSQVRLAPGESQTVRILVRPVQGIGDGEYRVHAVLRQLPNVAAVKDPGKPGVVAGVIGVEQSVAIPVIVLRGMTKATGSIASLKVVEGKVGQIDLQLGRSGNRSLYTNLYLKDKSGAIAKEVKGVAVPVPNLQRHYVMAVDKISSSQLRGGGYTLEMVDHDSGKVIDKRAVN
jgi:fimbrial chaperone protein